MQNAAAAQCRLEAAQYRINAEHQDAHGTASAAAQFRQMAADAEQRAAMIEAQS